MPTACVFVRRDSWAQLVNQVRSSLAKRYPQNVNVTVLTRFTTESLLALYISRGMI